MNFKPFLAAGAIIAALFAGGCCNRDTYRTLDGGVWNTTYHITYRSATDLNDSVLAVVDAVDMSLSTFNPASLVSAVNRGDSTARADALFREVFEGSLEVWKASGGRFDPTLGPAIRLWGFGPGHNITEATPARIDSVRALVGLGDCSIKADGRVVKKHPLTEFNFSAIAKGLACDAVAAMMRRNGVTDYLVEIGGEIALGGVNSHGEPWRIMIDKPTEGADGTPVHQKLSTVQPGSGGIATSGNYRNYHEIPGRGRVGHTIDASTCLPAEPRLLSVTVTAPSCMIADAIATACMTTGADSACMIIEAVPSAGALMVLPDSTVKIAGKFPKIR